MNLYINNMKTITAEIDITTTRGRKIACDLANQKEFVRMADVSQQPSGHRWETVFEDGIDRLSKFYGVDMRPMVYAEMGKLQ